MNTSSWQAVWLLAVEVGAVVLLTLLVTWRLRSVVWQRTLWQASLIALVGVLLVEFSAVSFPQGAHVEAPVIQETAQDFPVQSIAPSIEITDEFSENYQTASQVTVIEAMPVETAKSISSLLLAIALGIWVIGSVVLAGRLLMGRFLLLRFCARSRMVTDEELRQRMQSMARMLGLKQPVQVLETAHIQTPVVFGLFRPTIALPTGFTERFDSRQQEAILGHELAHLAARDPLWYLLADALVSVLWWHPLVWVARARLQVASELAADEACVLAEQGPETLAECLVSIAKEMHGPGAMESIGIEGSGFRSRLGQRVERLLQLSAEMVSKPALWRIRLVKVGVPVLLLSLLVVGTGWMRKDGSAPWSGVVNGAWDTAVGAMRVEEEVVRRDPRPVFMVAVPAGANAVSGSTGNAEKQYEAAVLLQAAKKLYGLGRLEEAEVKAKDAVKLSRSAESAAYLGYISELRRLEPKLREREQEVLAGANGKEVPVFQVIPIHEEALIKGLEKITGKKPELLSFDGQDASNRTVGAWKQVVDATKDVMSKRGVNVAKLEIGPEIMTYSGGQKLILLNINGLHKDLDAARIIVKEIHAASEQENKGGGSKALTVVNTESLPAPNPYVRTNGIQGKMPLRNLILVKLNQIVIKELHFEGKPLADVVQFLQEESVKLDPEKKGINFIINSNLDDQAANGGKANSTKLDLEKAVITINPPLKNLRMIDALDAISKVAVGAGEHGLAFMVEDYAVVFRQRVIEPAQLFTRIFKVETNAFVKGLEKRMGTTVDAVMLSADELDMISNHTAASSQDLRMYKIQKLTRALFLREGVNFELKTAGGAETQVFFNDRSGVLMVRATLEDLEIIQSAIERINTEVQAEAAAREKGELYTRVIRLEPVMAIYWLQDKQLMGTDISASALQTALVRYLSRELTLPVNAADGNGPTVALDLEKKRLTVRGTLKDLQVVESAMEVLAIRPAQVVVEARYIEVSDKAAKEMGLNWFTSGPLNGTNSVKLDQLSNPTIPTNQNVRVEAPVLPNYVSVLSLAQAEALVKRFESQDGSDVLSAPRVTTLSNRQARIEVSNQLNIVVKKQINAGAGPAGDDQTVFQTSSVSTGPTLEVLPKVAADGLSLQLDWMVCITEFVGYDKPAKGMDKNEPLPRFRVRQVANSSVLRDGQALLMGCGTSEVKKEKKGIFRSGSEVEKRHVIVMLTPRIIDPTGNLVNPGK